MDNYPEVLTAIIGAAQKRTIEALASNGPKGMGLQQARGISASVSGNGYYDDDDEWTGGFLRFGGTPALG